MSAAIKHFHFFLHFLANSKMLSSYWTCLLTFLFFIGCDCGVFTCMFCDFISNDCLLIFNQDHIDQCRDRIIISIMNNCAAIE